MASRRFGDSNGGSGAVVASGDVLGEGPMKRVFELVDLGALVSLSRSRDGGSVAITVTWDGEWERKWFRDLPDAQIALDEWCGLIEDLAGDPRRTPPAANQGRRKRGS